MFLKKLFSRNDKKQIEKTPFAEQRLDKRFAIEDNKIIKAYIDKQEFQLINISYGGALLKAPKHTISLLDLSAEIDFELHIFNYSINSKTKIAHIRDENSNDLLALQFIHNDTDILTALNEYMETRRKITTFVKIDKKYLKESDLEFHYYRADGPIDLKYKLEEDNCEIKELFLTIRVRENYYELQYKNKTLSSSSTIVENKPNILGLNSMSEDNSLNTLTTRYATIVLSSFAKNDNKFNKILELLYKEIS